MRERAPPDPVGGRRRPSRARDRGARRVLPSLPGTARLPHADLRGAASAGGIRGGDRGRRADRGEAARGAEARGARTLVVAPGDVNEAKQLDGLLAAVASLPDDVHVAVVGPDRRDLTSRRWPPLGVGVASPSRPDVTDVDFLAWLVAADVVVDLRYPHRGEVSGSLARAMQVGRPDDRVGDRHVPRQPARHGGARRAGPADAAELAAGSPELAADRTAASGSARPRGASWRRRPRREATAHGYAEAIARRATIVDDPVGPTMRRWAGRLADLGVGEGAVGGLRRLATREPWKASRIRHERCRVRRRALARLALTSGFPAALRPQGVTRSPTAGVERTSEPPRLRVGLRAASSSRTGRSCGTWSARS